MAPRASTAPGAVHAGPRRNHVVAAIGAGLLAVLLSFVPFVRPSSEAPRSADAIVVPSGDHGERRALAFRLLEEGVAATLVFDGTPDLGDEDRLCQEGWRGKEVICLRPDPDGTQQEAQALGRLAADRSWDSVVVVTTTYHAVRTGLLFRRCVDGHVTVVPARGSGPLVSTVRQTVREWFATAYFAVARRGC